MQYTFGLKNLVNFPFQKYPKDFVFIVDGKKYETTRVVADLLSPKIRKLHFVDESAKEFFIDTKNEIPPNKSDYFEDFLQICTKDQITLDPSHQLFYSIYFLQLGNIDEYFRIQSDMIQSISIENAIDILQIIEGITINFSESVDQSIIENIISYIAAHFEEIEKEKFSKLSIEQLIQIIESDSLKINDEDSLFRFIINLYEKDQIYSVLFEGVLFCNVSKECFKNFINIIDLNCVNRKIWNSIIERLNCSENNRIENTSRYRDIILEFVNKKDHEFEGIMNYLSKKTGGNIHQNGTIEIKANSNVKFSKVNDLGHKNSAPENLVDYDNNESYYFSDNEDNVIVSFDFKDKKICLSSYSLKSFGNCKNGSNMRNWVIEGSNNGNDWSEIDSHSNDPTLNGSKIVASFNVSKENDIFYRFIRLRQTGFSWSCYPNEAKYYIGFFFIEFFGKLKEK